MKNNHFPFGIYVGELTDKEKHKIPLFLPENTGGFSLLFEDEDEQKANQFIENIALKLFEAIKVGDIEIHVFDYSIKKRFSYLSSLQSYGLYGVSNNSQAANTKFNEFEQTAFYRHHNLLSSKNPTISTYNTNSNFIEKYYLLIINLEDFPDDLSSDKRVMEVIDAAYEAGIYIIAFGNKNEIENTQKKAVKAILKKYPLLEIEGDGFLLNSHNTLKSLRKLIKRHQCSIQLPMDDREKSIGTILSNLQKQNKDGAEQDFLSVPIGTTPDGRLDMNFSLGSKSENYHAFITGVSGSGKTTLLNNLILGIAQQYTSDEVRLYLMDYKEGVEFQVFKNHPNCEKIFLDNEDLQAATNLLEDFVKTIHERSTLFKSKEIKDIAEYNEVNPNAPIPRVILVIDEVHRLFSGSWGEKEHFSKLLKQVVRQGRSFGVHIILSTQTLAGTDIDKELMSQITLRISYKLTTPSDAEQIFTYGNLEPLKLNRYELIYNADSGAKDANVRCKVYAPKSIKSMIEEIRKKRDKSLCITPQIVMSATEKPIKTKVNDKELDTEGYAIVEDLESDYGVSDDKALLELLVKQGAIVNPLEEES